jgi:hypothetical protein
VASRIDTGMIVNNINWSDAELPFGGIKNSGYWCELSDMGIQAFVNEKLVRYAVADGRTETYRPARRFRPVGGDKAIRSSALAESLISCNKMPLYSTPSKNACQEPEANIRQSCRSEGNTGA